MAKFHCLYSPIPYPQAEKQHKCMAKQLFDLIRFQTLLQFSVEEKRLTKA